MRIFIISCVFPPEPVTTAYTSDDLAEEMIRRGHDVTVFVSFPNRPSGYVINGYTRRWKQVEYKNGYKVIHCWHTLSKTSKFISRAAENISFGLSSTWQMLMEKPLPDVVYINTWPLFSQGLNSWLLKRLDVPIFCSIQDVYPESLTGRGIIHSHSLVARLIHRVNKCFLHRCAMVASICLPMVELLIKNRELPSEKVKLIPNWLDASPFSPDFPKNGQFRNKFGIDSNIFLSVFAGSLTMAAGVDLYVQVAEKILNRQDIRILLVGDGSMRKKLESNIFSKQLNNIQVVSPLERDVVPEVQAAADVLLMSLSGEMAQSAVPSKLIAYMFSGRPIIASVSSENISARILIDANAGFVLPPDDPQAVADLLILLAENRMSLEQLGKNARKYAEANFSKQIVLPYLANLLESVARTKIRS